jgi:hypothetical protein
MSACGVDREAGEERDRLSAAVARRASVVGHWSASVRPINRPQRSNDAPFRESVAAAALSVVVSVSMHAYGRGGLTDRPSAASHIANGQRGALNDRLCV